MKHDDVPIKKKGPPRRKEWQMEHGDDDYELGNNSFFKGHIYKDGCLWLRGKKLNQ